MCGIAGLFDPKTKDAGTLVARVRAMGDVITHRGPNDVGVWVDSTVGLTFAHRRLSIIDLSPAGHQPMTSAGESWTIVFNGEIYNWKDIRSELTGYPFKGHSDTEVILAACESWGFEKTIGKLVGMFAMAVWDKKARKLWLARDRMGEKPLYYGQVSGCFAFGSEIKVLNKAAEGSDRPSVDRSSLALFLRHNYVPAPYTIFSGWRKLPPGCLICVEMDQFPHIPSPKNYWSVRSLAAGIRELETVDTATMVENLDVLLRQAVRGQMVADVPLGAFLSGGIDSSTIVALMQAQSDRPVKTFTIGFDDADFNEAEHAKAVARHLGTEHTELYVSPEEALAVIPLLPELYDEPFSDSSQIPTFLVSKMARQHVTVALSGDGGDELFGGYNRYFSGQSIWRKMERFPSWIRRGAASAIQMVAPTKWDVIGYPMRMAGHKNIGDRAHKLAGILGSESPDMLYHKLVSHWDDPGAIVIGAKEAPTPLTDGSIGETHEFVERMQLLDQLMYLPDDILVKVDRAAMGVSLETRVPFLDHRVVEFAWRLPLSLRVRKGVGKWLLRQVLDRYVPRTLIERPKMGFGIPLASWLRGPLLPWAESLLEESRLRREGYFHPELIRRKWAEHLSGRRNWQYHLWDILMFQAWQERWLRK